MQNGVVAGYPVIDVSVTLYDGAFHDVDSSVMALKQEEQHLKMPYQKQALSY